MLESPCARHQRGDKKLDVICLATFASQATLISHEIMPFSSNLSTNIAAFIDDNKFLSKNDKIQILLLTPNNKGFAHTHIHTLIHR